MKKIKTGAVVIVTEKVGDKEKERTSIFRGMVLARKHGSQSGATFTVRAVVDGVGVEKIYPFNSPNIISVKIISSPKKVGKAKLYWVRGASKKKIQQKLGVSL
ncbi:MAG: 50S ribosomal protein L19 [Candidatus Wolfebacteria bacterium GW2011_GWC1_43_10]|uniref:50S ribosomal protein L19 n=1 Tax=Candidatus Wolfebacteria bacterium GW2011_GWC1_43_10 TaxID=1619011 RepID=A0A0G1EHY2_9BACT|nr:MAG: 50S ribosomal protein L19 [Candidatus Wolfebacteria bacterium GW2011_GWC1_43_10]KKT22643.1 MAG: 50S ribosomal protein L19 [Parcubacteria group bacterium GW2011_GWB1_43_8b]